jgi:uncharacterized membrane protein
MSDELMDAPYADVEISQDDKLWALLSWIPVVGVILAIIALLIEPQKDSPFVRYHAVQSIAGNIVIGLVSMVLVVTVLLSCLAPFLSLATIYPAIKAYQGEWFEIPWLTQFCKDQGWI